MKFILSIPFLFLISLCTAQQYYEGRVVDGVSNETIENVNVRVVGSSAGASTDKDGNFELRMSQLPMNIIISHLGYEEEKRTIKNIPNSMEVIYLYPQMEILKEITITAENQVVPLSEVEIYSVSDFEITKDKIYRLEYHDIFQKFKISVTDLDGKLEQTVSLKELKGVHSLFQSCNGVIYIVANNFAYALVMKDYELVLDYEIKIDDFYRNVDPCKLRLNNKLYFLREKSNGLVSQITSYDYENGEHALLTTIAEDELLDNYNSDMYMISKGQSERSVRSLSIEENRKLRKSQKLSDFYLDIFYKPEFPVHISSAKSKVFVYNHIEGKIESYDNDILEREVAINYPLDKKWMKELRVDLHTEKVYGVFQLSTGIGLKEIDLISGKVKLVGIVETSLQNHQRIQVFNNSIYYLRSNILDGSKMELCKFEF